MRARSRRWDFSTRSSHCLWMLSARVYAACVLPLTSRLSASMSFLVVGPPAVSIDSMNSRESTQSSPSRSRLSKSLRRSPRVILNFLSFSENSSLCIALFSSSRVRVPEPSASASWKRPSNCSQRDLWSCLMDMAWSLLFFRAAEIVPSTKMPVTTPSTEKDVQKRKPTKTKTLEVLISQELRTRRGQSSKVMIWNIENIDHVTLPNFGRRSSLPSAGGARVAGARICVTAKEKMKMMMLSSSNDQPKAFMECWTPETISHSGRTSRTTRTSRTMRSILSVTTMTKSTPPLVPSGAELSGDSGASTRTSTKETSTRIRSPRFQVSCAKRTRP
mmetsp:Transcript_50150/g.143419  ORF Transcript_50150/g.143419 Transcript_50150/m.143419 type:complete len:332 (-) Transcript_50150:441-1436(-)